MFSLHKRATVKRRTGTDKNSLNTQDIAGYQNALVCHLYLKIFPQLAENYLARNKQTNKPLEGF